MAILAEINYKGETVTVEIVDAITTTDGRKLATVRSLNGAQLFCNWTQGGWALSDTTNLPAALVHNPVIIDEYSVMDQAEALAVYQLQAA